MKHRFITQLIGGGYTLKYRVPSDYILIFCGHPCHCVEMANFSQVYADAHSRDWYLFDMLMDAENKRKFHRTHLSE